MGLLMHAIRGMPGMKGKSAYRTSVEAWQHVIFGTWEKPEGQVMGMPPGVTMPTPPDQRIKKLMGKIQTF